jgi:hypothetical protein
VGEEWCVDRVVKIWGGKSGVEKSRGKSEEVSRGRLEVNWCVDRVDKS